MPPRHVVFRYRPPRAVPFVHLHGSMTHWLDPLELRPAPGGVLEAVREVLPGTYEYKLRLADGGWELDPENPRTRSVAGLRNNLLVVDGAAEPLLHAPARPWLRREDDGRLLLVAGLRHRAGAGLSVRWDDGHGTRLAPLAPVASEEEHLLMAAHLPACSRRLSYLFVLDDGRVVGAPGGAGQPFSVDPERFAPDTPAWWREAVVYTILVDRFRRGGSGGLWDQPRLSDDRRAGGDLAGVAEALPELRDLGVTVLHLTPLTPAPSAHRYDATDPREVDAALGGQQALVELLEAAHTHGLRVLLDVPLTHVHRDFEPFLDVRRRGPEAPAWDWFYVDRYPFLEGPQPGYRHYQRGRWMEPLLRTDHPEVRDYLVETAARWIRLGADGLRLDAVAEVPLELVAAIRQSVRRERADALLLGELTVDNPHRWLGGPLDAATDFSGQQVLYDWLWRRRHDARAAGRRWTRLGLLRGAPGWASLSFVGTHDQPRLSTLVNDPRITRLGLLAVLLRAGTPALLYGDEVGLAGGDAQRLFEDVWPDRRPMPWPPAERDETTRQLVKRALAVRRASLALREGDEAFPDCPAADVLVIRRWAGDEVVEAYLNSTDGGVEVPLAGDVPSGAESLLQLGEASLDDASQRVRLDAWAALVVRRVPPPDIAAEWEQLRRRNAELAHEAFRTGLLETPSLPVRLLVTVTERCNLRCRHCINHAPARTRGGIARTLAPWLLERLREPLRAADHVALTHGGESLLAPTLWDLLALIPDGRQVHLLSNGMLLTGETATRLVEAGVTSLAVSLDGATAATNDQIRLGGSLETVVANLRTALELRARHRWDLRVGISSVVTADNLAEVTALGELAADVGVDWLKVEELYPATPFARRQLVPPRDPRLRAAVERLAEQLRGAGIVLVDHLDPPQGCTCDARSDPAVAAFLEADGFAHRARFDPCRAPWEQACIEPDGTVRPVDYGYDPIGNLLDAPLPDLWSSAPMQRLRAVTLGRLPAQQRATCRS